MKKTSKSLLFALILGIAILASAVGGTYAKYTEKVEKEAKATVAKWAFADDNTTQSNYKFAVSETYDASTLVNGKIAPGTKGTFEINLVNTNTDTAVGFEILFANMANKPTNFHLYRTTDGSQKGAEVKLDGTGKVTGKLAAKDATGLTAKFIWEWAYETAEIAANDVVDTTDGKAAHELTMGVTITGTQIAPATSAVTSALD